MNQKNEFHLWFRIANSCSYVPNEQTRDDMKQKSVDIQNETHHRITNDHSASVFDCEYETWDEHRTVFMITGAAF